MMNSDDVILQGIFGNIASNLLTILVYQPPHWYFKSSLKIYITTGHYGIPGLFVA